MKLDKFNLNNYLSKLFYKLYRITTPKDEYFTPSKNDILLVSYPRSGSTWLRVMLADLIFGDSGESLKDLPYYMPEKSLHQKWSKIIESDFYIVKSHEIFRDKNWRDCARHKIIYLIRDPRDVALSYYRFQLARAYSGEQDQFINDFSAGRIWPYSWSNHVRGWTGRGIESYNLEMLILKYEDFLKNPLNQLMRVKDFIGISAKDDEITRAVANATKEKMREKENLGMWENSDFKEHPFIGPAKKEQWKQKLSVEQIQMINDSFRGQMVRFGYLE